MTTPTPRQRRALQVGCAAWAALALWQILWHGLWQPSPTGAAFWITTVCTLPLLLPLLALRRPHRALLLAGMLALFYFSHGVAEAWSVPAERAPALVEVALCVALIAALGATVQRRKPVST